jgi:hypothetical protein
MFDSLAMKFYGTSSRFDTIRILGGDSCSWYSPRLYHYIGKTKANNQGNWSFQTNWLPSFRPTIMAAASATDTLGNTSNFSQAISIKRKLVILNSNHDLDLNDLQIYPNPSSDKIEVEGFGKEKLNYEVMTLSGKSILAGETSKSNRFSINVASLNQGVYFLVVKNNLYSVTKKMVIMR